MPHSSIPPDLQDLAALHSLGLLPGDESAELERHLAECEVCRSEAQNFERAVVDLVWASSLEPPTELRSRVLAAIEQPLDAPIRILRSGQDSWLETPFPGVLAKALYQDPATRNVTQLIRLAPGAHYPPHRHFADEQCYVIEGDLRIGEDVFGAGDFTVAASGTDHGGVSSRNGCLLLIVASPDNQVLESAST